MAIRFNRVENGVTYATVNGVRSYRLDDQGDSYFPQRNATILLTTIFSTAPSRSCAGASNIMPAALRGEAAQTPRPEHQIEDSISTEKDTTLSASYFEQSALLLL